MMAIKTVSGLMWGIVGIGMLIMPLAVAAGASDTPVTGGTVTRDAKEAVTASKDYTIQQKDAFQRKIQAELKEMQVRIARLYGQVGHASASARADIQKSIVELEKQKELAGTQAQEIHFATAASWERVQSKTAAAMDDLRKSFNQTLSHLSSR